MNTEQCLWSPSAERSAATHVEKFRGWINERHDLDLADYADLHSWSVDQSELFWSALWDYAEIRSSARGDIILENAQAMPGARWFPQARLNFAENLLLDTGEGTAVVFQGEEGEARSISHAQLYSEVRAVAQGLRNAGVTVGDSVAGFYPISPRLS